MGTGKFLKEIAENKDKKYGHYVASYENGMKLVYLDGNGGTAVLPAFSFEYNLSEEDSLVGKLDVFFGNGGVRYFLKRDCIFKYPNMGDLSNYYFLDNGVVVVGFLGRKNLVKKENTITKKVRSGFLWLRTEEVVVKHEPAEYKIEESKVDNVKQVVLVLFMNCDLKVVGRVGGWLGYSLVLPEDVAERFIKLVKQEPGIFTTLLRMVYPEIKGIHDLKRVSFIYTRKEFDDIINQFNANISKIIELLKLYKQKYDDPDYDELRNLGENQSLDEQIHWIQKMIRKNKQDKIREIIKILDSWV